MTSEPVPHDHYVVKMRPLDTTTFELVYDNHSVFKQEGYAILSHRWIDPEITFNQLGRHIDTLQAAGTTPLKSPQQEKIRGACQIARAKGIKWIWIDTCCIDKSNATELSEALNSMFQWYSNAKLCITYLSDVVRKGGATSKEDFINEAGRHAEWFSRGWTLQELLAPHHLEFFDKNWEPIGNRAELAAKIERITRIQSKYLKGDIKDNFMNACIAAKFSWMASRQTKHIEDIAYSMLGLFSITMAPLYGEGWGAFMRLQKELLQSDSMDESLFAWRMPQADSGLRLLSEAHIPQRGDWKENEWGLLASQPGWFKECGHMTIECPKRMHIGFPRGKHIERYRGPVGIARDGLNITFGSAFGTHHEVKSGLLYCCFIPLVCVTGGLIIYPVSMSAFKEGGDFEYTLNCWNRNARGNMVRVRIWLHKFIGKKWRDRIDSMQGVATLKRVRCADLIQNRDKMWLYGRTRRPGIVLQPF